MERALLECFKHRQSVASRTKVDFAVETLEYLHKGGTIHHTAARFPGYRSSTLYQSLN
jgi:fatty acid-binding protein DegV